MILFYYDINKHKLHFYYKFQFHYDLILLWRRRVSSKMLKMISISLWSYSICAVDGTNCSYKIISISLWSYSIEKTWIILNPCGFNFNFIMILFYFCVVAPVVSVIVIFQFHYDLILLGLTASAVKDEVRFQFHYDLILLIIWLKQKRLME